MGSLESGGTVDAVCTADAMLHGCFLKGFSLYPKLCPLGIGVGASEASAAPSSADPLQQPANFEIPLRSHHGSGALAADAIEIGHCVGQRRVVDCVGST